jgi:PiT family inorganic phosphate transporter
VLPAIASPIVAAICAATATYFIYRVAAGVADRFLNSGFRWGQIATATLVSLAHGTNDAQKTMGVITLALLASRHWTSFSTIPFWVKLVCALAIALGTYLGGWRIIRTLGKGLVEIEPPQGVAAESVSAAVILGSRCRPLTLRPDRSSEPASEGGGRRCAGESRAAWQPAGC